MEALRVGLNDNLVPCSMFHVSCFEAAYKCWGLEFGGEDDIFTLYGGESNEMCIVFARLF